MKIKRTKKYKKLPEDQSYLKTSPVTASSGRAKFTGLKDQQ